jgi:hypothetical protein
MLKTASYRLIEGWLSEAVWNALQKIIRSLSEDEKHKLFLGTATRHIG